MQQEYRRVEPVEDNELAARRAHEVHLPRSEYPVWRRGTPPREKSNRLAKKSATSAGTQVGRLSRPTCCSHPADHQEADLGETLLEAGKEYHSSERDQKDCCQVSTP